MRLKDRLITIPYSNFVASHFYPFITRMSGDDLVFLNWGYEEDPPMALPLAASDEPNRFPIQLYHRMATQADLTGKRVLEVSCGHGGGASYLMRTLRPASYTGLDLNAAGIDFCRNRHHLPDLDFVHGDAENLPFPDQSFDAVINVEVRRTSTPSFPRFLAEVARVLRPGGHFLYADSRRATMSPSGRRRWPTPRCGWCRTRSSTRRLCAGWRRMCRSCCRCSLALLRRFRRYLSAGRSSGIVEPKDLLPDVLLRQRVRRRLGAKDGMHEAKPKFPPVGRV